MINEFEELENKIKNSQLGSDYLLSGDGQGKKSYTILSNGLKQSLRDVVHSAVFGGWQISHTLGRNYIEYKKKQSGKFGLYRKSLLANDDELLIFPEGGQISAEEQNFEEARQRVVDSERRISESEQRIKESELRAIESEQRALESEKRLKEKESQKDDNYVSLSVQWNEDNQKIMTAEKHFDDASAERAFKDSPGWEVAQAVARAMAGVGNEQNSQGRQQTQIVQKEQPKLPSPQDKGGNK